MRGLMQVIHKVFKGFSDGSEETTKKSYMNAYLEGFRMKSIQMHCPLPSVADTAQKTKSEEQDVEYHSDSAFSCIQSKITDYFKPKKNMEI